MRYLIITYYKKPSGQIDEAMAVSKSLKTRDIQCASVILDFKLQRVEKCSMGDVVVPRNWDRIVSYYYQYYANVIERLFTENGHAISIVADQPQQDKIDQ